MPKPETEPPKTDRVYTPEDAKRDYAIIWWKTFVRLSEIDDEQRRTMQWVKAGCPNLSVFPNLAELLRAKEGDPPGTRRNI